jgi:hypothetical protein
MPTWTCGQSWSAMRRLSADGLSIALNVSFRCRRTHTSATERSPAIRKIGLELGSASPRIPVPAPGIDYISVPSEVARDRIFAVSTHIPTTLRPPPWCLVSLDPTSRPTPPRPLPRQPPSRAGWSASSSASVRRAVSSTPRSRTWRKISLCWMPRDASFTRAGTGLRCQDSRPGQMTGRE